MATCEVCSANVQELRRGRCWGCYQMWAESRPVGLGATCCLCGERRRSRLKSVELLGRWMPVCHNCSAEAGRLEPLPQSIAGIRAALLRERRIAERRWGKEDARVFQYERRQGERRGERPASIDDDMIVEVAELDAYRPATQAELTMISERPD